MPIGFAGVGALGAAGVTTRLGAAARLVALRFAGLRVALRLVALRFAGLRVAFLVLRRLVALRFAGLRVALRFAGFFAAAFLVLRRLAVDRFFVVRRAGFLAAAFFVLRRFVVAFRLVAVRRFVALRFAGMQCPLVHAPNGADHGESCHAAA
jgi:hypothetical protein